VAGEREMLDGWLEWHRATLLYKCAGLTARQLKQRAVEPSNLSLLGLVRHMAEVERGWFQRRVAGQDVPLLFPLDGDFDDVDEADAEADLATYGAEVSAARATVADRSLDELFFHPRMEEQLSVRWVVVHMIEEYARHNGHADLLRERVDGSRGP
jgi:uncharacterized damage-inducible protein DinB